MSNNCIFPVILKRKFAKREKERGGTVHFPPKVCPLNWRHQIGENLCGAVKPLAISII